MVERPYRNKDWLYDKYYTQDMTTKEIAELPESCNRKTLNTWLNRNGIQRTRIPELPYETLIEKYKSGDSIHDLAEEYDVDAVTIVNRMERMGFTPDRGNTKDLEPDFDLHDNGDGNYYERCRCECGQAYIHQLLAIAEGANPYQIFSNKRYHVHHKNEIPWDNRPSNIKVLTAEKHAKKHHG